MGLVGGVVVVVAASAVVDNIGIAVVAEAVAAETVATVNFAIEH